MELEDLWDRHLRLRRALSTAYQASRWRSRRIDMLADALAVTERDIAALGGGATTDWPPDAVQPSVVS